MGEVTGEDIERLANRMAMLVSDDGEADNAGRAVGQLARRLGLSGGDLKAMVLAGAGKGFRPGNSPATQRLEQEIDALRRELREAREAAGAERRDREALAAENGAMRVAMYRQRAGAKMRGLVLGLGAIGVAAVAAGVVLMTPDTPAPPFQATQGLRQAPQPSVQSPRGVGAAPAARAGRVRGAGAAVYSERDRGSPVVMRLAAGTPLVLQRDAWRGMLQWWEVEVGGQVGYVLATEIDF